MNGLTPDDREQPAGRVVALALGATLVRYRELTDLLRVDTDSVHLHQARIALRQARSVAHAAGGVIAEEELELLRALMGEVARLTNAARDLDVLLDALDARVDELAEPLRSGTLLDGRTQLRGELERRRHGELRAVIEQFDGPVHQVMVRRWRRLGNPYRLGGAEPGRDHLRPAGDVVDEHLRHAWAALVSAGRRATDSGAPADWHRARKRAKRVRYLLASYEGLYEADTWRRPLQHLRRLQNGLGELQDLEAAVGTMIAAGRRLGRDGQGEGAVLAGALVVQLTVDRADLLERIDEVWDRFDRPKVHRRFERALEPPS